LSKNTKHGLSGLSIEDKGDLIRKYLYDIQTHYIKKEAASTKDMKIKDCAVNACSKAIGELSKQNLTVKDILEAVGFINKANEDIGKARGILSLGGFWEKNLSEIERIVFSIPEVSKKIHEDRIETMTKKHGL